MAIYTRVKTFVAEILTPADLNAEFDAVKASVNGIDKAQMNANSIGSSQLESASVTNAKVANAAVDTDALAASAVTNAKMADDAVDRAELADDAVGSEKMEIYSATAVVPQSSTTVLTHGLTDENGNDRAPLVVLAMTEGSGSNYRVFVDAGNNLEFKASGTTQISVRNTSSSGGDKTVFIVAF